MEKPCICTLCDTGFTLKQELVDHVLLQHTGYTGEKLHAHQPKTHNSCATFPGHEQMDYNENYSSPDVSYGDQNSSMKHDAENEYHSFFDINNLEDIPKEELVDYIDISPTFDKQNGKEELHRTQADLKFKKELNDFKDNAEVIAKLPTSRQLTDQLLSLELPIIGRFGEQQSSDVFEDVKKDGATESVEDVNKFKSPEETEVTDNSRIFVCGMCNKVFKEECELQNHTLTHNTTDWFKCTICEKTFSGKYYLLKHKRTCGYKMSTDQMDNWQEKHLGFEGALAAKNSGFQHTKPYQCKMCKGIFLTASEIESHKCLHIGEKPYECSVCGKCFTDKYRLRRHNMVHTGQKPFECTMCGKRFSQISSLRRHKLKEDIEYRLHQCTKCGKTFTEKSNCVRHEKKCFVLKPHGHNSNELVLAENKTFLHKQLGKLNCYVCNVCQKSFNTKDQLAIHKEEHTYQCKMCGEMFIGESNLSKHVQIHTAGEFFNCHTCGKVFSKMSQLQRHGLLHEKENVPKSSISETENVGTDVSTHRCEGKVKSYECSICRKAFRTNYLLRNHFRIHTGERPFKCDVCGMTFIDKSNLSRHGRVHTGEKPYKCEFCEKTFSLPTSLKIHKMTHTKETPFKCEICGKAYKTSTMLKRHTLTHLELDSDHLDLSGNNVKDQSPVVRAKTHACTLYDKEFSTNHQLTLHVKSHTGKKPYQCIFCDKAYTEKCILTRHMWRHSDGNPHECTWCEKSFATKHLLIEHEIVHIGKPYPCRICGKRFDLKCVLTKHERIHSAEKKLKCDVCEKAFREKSSLRRHMRIHTGEKPFACVICGTAFSEQGNLRRHERAHLKHSDIQ